MQYLDILFLFLKFFIFKQNKKWELHLGFLK